MVARLRSPQDSLRWTSPESWHITLQFLGNTDQKHCDCALARLVEIHAAPVQVRLGELGFFDRAGVFLADVVPTADLVALAQGVTAATARCGFVAESRPYHPHITLARAKGEGRGGPLRALQERMLRDGRAHGVAKVRAVPPFRDETPEGWGTHSPPGEQRRFGGFSATEFLLYESHTRPEGAEYEVRGRFPLGTDG